MEKEIFDRAVDSSEFFMFAAIMIIFGGAWMREISEKIDELKGDKK